MKTLAYLALGFAIATFGGMVASSTPAQAIGETQESNDDGAGNGD